MASIAIHLLGLLTATFALGWSAFDDPKPPAVASQPQLLLTYEASSISCRMPSPPNLVVYADGLLLSRGRTPCGGVSPSLTSSELRAAHLDNSETLALMRAVEDAQKEHVTTLGSTSPSDGPFRHIEARGGAGSFSVTIVGTSVGRGGVATLVSRLDALLLRPALEPYEAHGYRVDVLERVGKPARIVDWPIEDVDLGLQISVRPSFLLGRDYSSALRRTSDPYIPTYVRQGEHVYLVTWRPVLPHE